VEEGAAVGGGDENFGDPVSFVVGGKIIF